MNQASGTMEHLGSIIASLKQEQAGILVIGRPLTSEEAQRLDQIADSLPLLTTAVEILTPDFVIRC